MTRSTLAADETLAAPENGSQMTLTDDPISVTRSLSGDVTHNIGTEPITVVEMTTEFQPVPGTPSAATPTSVASDASPAI